MATEYISREAAIEALCKAHSPYPRRMEISVRAIQEIPAAVVRPVVLCRDCKFWKDRYVLQNDGTERQYNDGDGFFGNSVTADIGINMGSRCRIEDGKGWSVDKSVHRRADDFCSRGERRPCSYEEWWGIVDGVYPKAVEIDQVKEGEQ